MNDDQLTLLSAYQDGELTPAERQQVDALLSRDPEARAYLAGLRRCDERLQRAFGPIATTPIPPQMLAAIRRNARPRWQRSIMPLALAASVIALAVVVGRQTITDQQMERQLIDMRQQIAQLRYQTLENTPSGTAASWVAPSGGVRAEVRPLQTYRTSDNQFCREYEERVDDGHGVEVRRGVACRTGKALWPDRMAPPDATDVTSGGGMRL
jgi:anti-sigma factor RsiW